LKAFIVGVTRVASGGFLSDLNNFKTYPAYTPQYSDRFGFTESEVTALLKHHHLNDKADEVKEWYDGYAVANNVHLYNPWSIVAFIEESVLKAHWVNTGKSRIV
jgi:hypothetical protein